MNTMKGNKNLDLDQYQPYMHEFQMYSIDLFDFGDKKLFCKKIKDESMIDEGLKRTYQNEFINI